VIGDFASSWERVAPPVVELHVARSFVIGAPPSSAGLVNATVMLRSPTAFTDVIVGAAGALGRTTTEEDGVDAGPVPTALVAVTVQV